MTDETNTVIEIHPKVLIDAALKYAERGFRVLPLHTIKNGICSCGDKDCRSPAKHPLTPHGAQDASSDEMTIRGWWSKWPQANIGLAMGDSGCVALDVDTRNMGLLTWEQIATENGELPETPTQRTGNGCHYLVRIDPAAIPRVRGKLGPGIDIKANGYIVAEPSIHHSGRRYAWDDGLDVLQGFMPAQAPVWLARMLVEPLGDSTAPSGPNLGVITLPVQLREAADALTHLDSDDYHQWIEAGMALHATGLGDAAYQVWVDWSQTSPKFDHKAQRAKWVSFGRNRQAGVTIKTIFSRAQAIGWINPMTGTSSTPDKQNKSEIVERLKSWKPIDAGKITEIREVEYYVDGLIQLHLAGSLVSQGGTGKTSILMLLGIETALGGNWFGMTVTQGAFVLLSLDDAQEDLDACFAMILREKAFSPAQIEIVRTNVRLISLRLIEMTVKFAEKDGQSFMSTGLDLAMIEGLSEIPNLRCVALDTLRQFAGGTTNDDQLVTVATKAITRVADSCGCAAIVNHHGTKQGAREGLADQYSGAGSGALADNLRFILNLVQLKTEDARKMLNLTTYDDHALDNGSVVLELVDTRGSLLRKPIDPIYILREGFKFKTMETSKKTPAQRNMEKFKKLAKIIKDKGPQSRNALFVILRGKKQEFLELITGWQTEGFLLPLGTGSSSVIDLTEAGKVFMNADVLTPVSVPKLPVPS